MNTTALANALKSVFGNNTTDNPSSSSKIPYCGSDGLPAGLASMGNLASVLGGVLGVKVILGTANTWKAEYENLPSNTIFLIEETGTLENPSLALGFKSSINSAGFTLWYHYNSFTWMKYRRTQSDTTWKEESF